MAHTVVAMKQFSLILKNLCKQASSLRTYKLCSTFSKLATPCISQVADTSDPTLLQLLNDDLVVKNSFITDTEESSILAEINPYMSRLRYEYDHWDDVSKSMYMAVADTCLLESRLLLLTLYSCFNWFCISMT